MRCITPQATSRCATMASAARHPGVRDRFEHHIVVDTEQTRPTYRHPPPLLSASVPSVSGCSQSPRLNLEDEAVGRWESEPLIVALKPGNAGGAKGWRRSIARQGNMRQTPCWRYA